MMSLRDVLHQHSNAVNVLNCSGSLCVLLALKSDIYGENTKRSQYRGMSNFRMIMSAITVL